MFRDLHPAVSAQIIMIEIDEAIVLNQLAQGIVSDSEGDVGFRTKDVNDQRRVLLGLNGLVLQASPRMDDAPLAISEARLAHTLTPCVLIMKPDLGSQLSKLARLPEPELPRAFRLLVKLLGVADGRRRREKPRDLVNHWWHRDLSDPKVLEEIKRAKG